MVARFTATRRLKGFIGIETHNRGSVQFRNLHIKDL